MASHQQIIAQARSLPWRVGLRPEVLPGDTVYVVEIHGAFAGNRPPVEIIETTVRSVECSLFQGGDADTDEPLVLAVLGYRFSEYLAADLEGGLTHPRDVYRGRYDAEQAAEWLPLAQFTDADWLDAIGLPIPDREPDHATKRMEWLEWLEKGNRAVERSNLPVCCANISDAREMLELARQRGGIIARDRDYLTRLLAGHAVDSNGSLSLILATIGIDSDAVSERSHA